MSIRIAQRLDALAILIAAIGGNYVLDGGWELFALFALLPDVALLAYIGQNERAALPRAVYNTLHTYAAPLVLSFALWPWEPVWLLGWVGHIALDRVLGFGLKSAQGFKVTHIQLAEGQNLAREQASGETAGLGGGGASGGHGGGQA